MFCIFDDTGLVGHVCEAIRKAARCSRAIRQLLPLFGPDQQIGLAIDRNVVFVRVDAYFVYNIIEKTA